MNCNRVNTLVRHIQDFQFQLDYMMKNKTFIEITKNQKTISQKFSLLFNTFKKYFKTPLNVMNYFDKPARVLQTIIKSVAGSQFEHGFRYFGRNLRQYEKFSKQKLILKDPQEVVVRQSQNLKCQYFQILTQKQINYKQFQTSKRINNFVILNNIQKNNIILPNLSCIGCSPFLIKDKHIINSNPCFDSIIPLSKKQASSEIIFSKYVCALANSGGGIIIVGAEKTKYGIKATGINFNEIVEVQAQIEIMSNLITNLNKNLRFTIQKSLVINDPFEQSIPANFCYKIFIFPMTKNNKTYTCFIDPSLFSKGTQYEVYHLINGKAQQILSKQEDQYTYYKLIHSNYSHVKDKSTKSSHTKIICSNSCNQLLQQYVKSNSNSITVHQEITPVEIQGNQNMEEKQCIINYNKQCLLLVGFKRQTKLIKELNRHLQQKKYLYQITKPFDGQFVEKGRAVYLICHNHKNELIKEVTRQSDKTGGITMIPVFTTLQVDKSSKVVAYRDQLFNQIYEKFNEHPFEKEGTTNKDVLLYSLNDKKQAIYTYMIFEHILNIRPFFVKENAVYSSKKEHYQYQ